MTEKIKSAFDKLVALAKGTKKTQLDENGYEVPDPTPLAIPVGFQRPMTVAEQMAKYMRSAALIARDEQQGSWEEEDDFDIPDEDMSSPWETVFDPVTGQEMSKQMKAELDAQQKAYDSHAKKKLETFVSNKNKKAAEKKKSSEEEED